MQPSRGDKRSRFKYGVYDIETMGIESLEVSQVGFYDGEQYLNFPEIGQFFDKVFTKKYNGWRFFAHFGGRFDCNFLFDWLRENRPETMVRIICSGSSVICMTVSIGKCRYRFCDSFRLLPAALETLTREFNVEHQKLPFDPTSVEYNRHDCLGLYEVLERFFDLFLLCSETIASHSVRLFRRRFFNGPGVWQPYKEVEDFCRRCYHGGRCEIYRYDGAENLNHYDINSAYGWAMMFPVALEYLWASRRLTTHEKRIGFYEAEIDVPETYLPVLPVKCQKLFFPFGKLHGFWSSLELARAEGLGAKIRILDGRIFYAEDVLRGYAETLYAMKLEAEKKGELGKRYVMKLLLNSLYGKFGQGRDQISYLVDDGSIGLFPLPNGLAYKQSFSRAATIMPHIAATVTCRARLLQHDYLQIALDRGGRLYYGDTDSVFTDQKLPVSDRIGDMKHEGSGSFLAYHPKEYEFDNKLHLKGLRTKSDHDLRLARDYLEGRTVTYRRMAGIGESIRAGCGSVRHVQDFKSQQYGREKRRRLANNDTMPWCAEVLQ